MVAIVAATAAALASGTSPVSANNDPHRMYMSGTPFELPAGYCSFPVRVTFPVDKEYGTITTAPDGSTVIKVTGSVVVTVTNEVSGASVTLNASGPGTFTISADGTSEHLDGDGLGLVYGANLTAFGLPSGLVQTSGPLHAAIDTATQNLTSLNSPHVLLDVCAALS